jgi:hypothetical protein
MKSFPRMLSQRWNAFRVCSASDEICSAYAQHILNDVFEMGSDFLLYWACAIIGYLLAEHAWKLVTRWLSMRRNWLLFGWASAEIGYSLAEHTRKFVFIGIEPCFSPVIRSPVIRSPVPFTRPSSNVLWLLSVCSLSPILYSLSQVSVPCFPSTVPCLTSLFLVSHPLFHVSLLCSLFPALCLPPSVPCLTSLFFVCRPLFHVSLLCSCLLSSVPCLTSLFLVSHPLFPVLRLSVPCIPSSFLGNL